ncbi:VOC family protein [Pseudonocardia sp. HH130630-07]|uniref:VOC family protein n=1 Tax=Pseudonocardia sp. HH130630-07 TaxID=1690815 RepID=UPI000814C862|nr:VOC family protein [Pseudonocardia sp. HH130630-07]ANY06593.1 hypothetical protein AFB00_10150 [Pseudonocardia sp. HH130630-07]
MSTDILLPAASVPGSAGVLNVFLIVDDAASLLTFVTEVFDVSENPAGRAHLPGGEIIHSEVRIGGSDLMVADRLPGWPSRPGLLQIWVTDTRVVLDRAVARGAEIVTEPTPFYGETTLARMLDRWGNLWWLWSPAPGQPGPEYATDDSPDTVFTTLDTTLRALHDGS